MNRKLIAFALVAVTRYMYNSKRFSSEWEIIFHTVNDILISGWMIYLIVG